MRVTPSIHTDAKGVHVVAPSIGPRFGLPAVLLATLARPPGRGSVASWQLLVRAVRRVHFLRGERAGIDMDEAMPWLVPNDLTLPAEQAEQLLHEASLAVDRALGAAHAMWPFLMRALAVASGRTPDATFRPTTLRREMARVMWQEEIRLDTLKARHGCAPSRRFPTNSAAGAERNFRERVIRPGRGVIHIACALAFTIDETERRLRKTLSPERAKLVFPQDANGPRLDMEHLLLIPELAERVVVLAEIFERALPHLEAQRPREAEVVRLRIA